MSTTRSVLLSLHRWIGLALCALLLIQGLSGAVLVFRDPLERMLHPELVVGETSVQAPIQSMIDVVRAANPDRTLRRIDLPVQADQTATVELDGPDGTWVAAVDPATATIVRQGGLEAWPLRWLFELHHALLAGDSGEAVVGIGGLALLFLAITGPIVWWPGLKRWRNGFRLWRGKGAERLTRSLHRAGGAVLALVLIFSAATGAAMAFKTQVRDGLRLAGPIIDKPAPKVAKRPEAALLPVDALIARAQAEHGPERLQQLRFPGGTGRVVAVYLDAEASPRPNASKQIWYDAYTGERLGAYVWGEVPAGNEAIDWLFPLHTGAAGGLLLMLVLFLGGLGLAGLSGSGVYLWVARRVSRRRPARRGAVPQPVGGR